MRIWRNLRTFLILAVTIGIAAILPRVSWSQTSSADDKSVPASKVERLNRGQIKPLGARIAAHRN